MIDITVAQGIIALLVFGIGPGSGVYIFGRQAMKNIEAVQKELHELRIELRQGFSSYTELRERVSINQVKIAAIEATLNAIERRVAELEHPERARE